MDITQLLIYSLLYLLPSFWMFGLGSMVFIQNWKRLENNLVALLNFVYSILFLEEFIRHLLPISYSPILVNYIFGQVGLLTLSLSFHLLIHTTKMYERYRIPFYPYIFYVPVLLIMIVTLFGNNVVNNTEFIAEGIWYHPVFNENYYLTLTISNCLSVLIILILLEGIRSTKIQVKRKLLQFLLIGITIGLVMNVVLGYPNYSKYLPPHPYLLFGVIFTLFLSIAVVRFQLIPSVARRYRTVFDLNPVAILLMNKQWEILEMNNLAKQTLQFDRDRGATFLHQVQLEENRERIIAFRNYLDEQQTVRNYLLTVKRAHNNEVYYLAIDASVLMLDGVETYYLLWRDVTEEKQNEKLVEFLAYHDALTNLHNRRYFVLTVPEKIAALSNIPERKVAIIMLDLNKFKTINDTFGHAVGDDILRHAATILQESTREADIVVRLGGDEFVVYMEGFPSEMAVWDWVQRLRNSFLERPFYVNEQYIEIEASIGVAFYPTDGTVFEDLFHQADLNMYKDKGRLKEHK